jgi:phosphate transport system permease protein
LDRAASAGEVLTKLSAGGAALVLVVMLFALVGVLAVSSIPAWKHSGASLIWGSQWEPNGAGALLDAQGNVQYDEYGELKRQPPVFGALPVIWGTAASSAIALIVAVPLSLGAAMFLVRVAPMGLSSKVAFLIEGLAAIPSLAYGIWGYAVLGPFLQKTIEAWAFKLSGIPQLSWLFTQSVTIDGVTTRKALAPTGTDLLCAGLVLAIMIVPIITALARDILRSVPRAQIEGTTALGATWWQSSFEMLRFSRAALFGAVMLGLARAAGETIAVTLVIGNAKQILPTPFAAAQTMASLLATEFGEAANNPLHRGALWAVALMLLVMSLLFNVIARYLFVGAGARTAGAH